MTGAPAWSGSVEHRGLLTASEAAVRSLKSSPQRLRPQHTQHWQHSVMAHRVAALAAHLEGVLALTLRDLYAPALALARTSLEHTAIDQLIFLADKYVQVVDGVTDDIWAQWQESREAKEAWTLDFASWQRVKNRAWLVREGIPVKSDSGETQYLLSYYYRLLERYQPFAPRPSEVERFDDGLGDLVSERRRASSNKDDYDLHLRWPSIKRSLQVNGLATEFALEQLECHYRFLSAFTHPTTDTRGLLYGRNQWSVPCYDHYASELCLLYVAVLAAWELQNFSDMSQRQPIVALDGENEAQELRQALNAVSLHLWFVGQPPHEYDRNQARNQAFWRAHRASDWEVPIPRLDVNDEDIGYYSDPLERLVNMHRSSRELSTGHVYQSPWPRQDAPFR